MSRDLESGPSGAARLLGRRLTRAQLAVAVALLAEMLYVVVRLAGGINSGDAFEETVPSWAIAHGSLACAYPGGGVGGNPFGAPLYAFLTAGPLALMHLGRSVAFPAGAVLGAHCLNAAAAIVRWAAIAGVTSATLQLSYLAPVALALGVIVLVRTTPQRGTLWEPIAVAILFLSPPVVSAFLDYFHPQDLLALGLLLAAVGLGLRDRWALAGVLLALAFTSQQFAVLVVAPLVVVVPGRDRWRLVLGFAATLAPIAAALDAVSTTSALRVLLLGSDRITLGANLFTSHGGTVLWELHLHGAALFLLTRAAPVVAAMALARVLVRQRAGRPLDPATLVSLVGVSLALRLVFEVNLFGYYFAAVAVTLVSLDVLRGRLRLATFAWLSLTGIAFDPLTQSASAVRVVYVVAVAVAVVVVIVRGARRRMVRWGAIGYGLVLVLADRTTMSALSLPSFAVPSWVWQVVLVPWAIWLVGRPVFHALARDATVFAA